ncbi:MAG: family 78 glycoside hydrolase catalytic domain [Clostridiales bacterium]|nr:family 78 glycoside hydrolase catalytic domain [Clostridiales bacterium]
MEKSKWITCNTETSVPIIRRCFETSDVQSASIEITGLGYFELYINGRKVSEDRFVPAFTNYCYRDTLSFKFPLDHDMDNKVFYLKYDITDYIKNGENLIEIYLGPGFFVQSLGKGEGNVSFSKKTMARYEIELEGKTGKKYIYSDGTETFINSKIRFSNMYKGEVIDSRYNDDEPKNVSIVESFETNMVLQTCPTDKVIYTITPEKVRQNGSISIYDCHENITGVARVLSGAPEGSRISLKFSEVIRKDKTLDYFSTGANWTMSDGSKQIQCDEFVTNGHYEWFEPKFVWHGFRYIEVVGDIDAIEVEVIRTDIKVASKFETDNSTLNWIYDAYLRAQMGNYHGCIPSDCPHRERLGYTGDGEGTFVSASMCFDTKELYLKWIDDIFESQDKKSGHIPHTSPLMGGGGGPGAFGCAAVIVPYEFYKFYGDKEILSWYYSRMKHWIEYLETRSENGLVVREESAPENIISWCFLGDWDAVGNMTLPPVFVNTCYFIDSLTSMIEICRITGHEEDKEYYEKLRSEAEIAIRKEFYDEKTGNWAGDEQGANAFAVWCNLDCDGRGLQNLIADYKDRDILNTGFFGTEKLVGQFIESGKVDEIVTLLEKSFKTMIDSGATTLWERFDGYYSQNHHAYGGFVRHFFDGLAGIKQVNGSVGYKDVVISPKLSEKISKIDCSMNIGNGRKISVLAEGNHVVADIPEGVHAVLDYGGKTQQLAKGINDIFVQF